MKFQSVRSNKLIWILSLFVLLIGILGYTALSLATPSLQPRKGTVQMGFYDLMSQQKELYDSHLTSVNGTILNTITDPNDTRFVVKGKFTETKREMGKVYYLYSQIYYSNPYRRVMIDGLIDFMQNTELWMIPLELDGQPLVIGQTGMIFLYPLNH